MQRWDDKGHESLWLFTPEEMTKVPDGTILETIGGEFVVKGVDRIDDDVRFGHLAYGVRDPFNHEHKDIFLLFLIA